MGITQGLFKQPLPGLDRLDYLSPSKIKLLNSNPRAFYKKYCKGPKLAEEKTKALKVGDFAHQCLLEPDRFSKLVISPEFSGTGSKAAKQAWLAKLPAGAEVIDEEDKAKVEAMIDSVLSDPEARALMRDLPGANEVCAYGQRKDGIWLHGRMDRALEGPSIIEFKTTSGAVDWDAFVWDVYEYDYHMAVAVYSEILEAIEQKPIREVAWIVAQSVEPYSVRVHYPQEENMLDIGRFDMNRGIERFRTLMALDPALSDPRIWFSGRQKEEDGPCAFPYHILIRKPEWQSFLTGGK